MRKEYHCPYCDIKLPIEKRPALPYETELTGQRTTITIKACPNGCMHREAGRKGLIKE